MKRNSTEYNIWAGSNLPSGYLWAVNILNLAGGGVLHVLGIDDVAQESRGRQLLASRGCAGIYDQECTSLAANGALLTWAPPHH